MARTRPKAWLETLFAAPAGGEVLSDRYVHVSQRPWPSLLFILPMLLVFEVGTAWRNHGYPSPPPQLVATYLIELLVNLFGRSAFYLPGLLAGAILLAAHIVGRHPWRFDIFVLPAMLGESLISTLPLFMLDRVLHAAVPASAAACDQRVDLLIRGLGAGIYEELVFRLMLITGLQILLVNICRLPRNASMVAGILVSAGLFAAQHHPPLGAEPFEAVRFLFRTAAGLYLAGLFVFRGFGIACGCHALYNVLVVTVRAIQGA